MVFGQSERDLTAVTGNNRESPTPDLPCPVVSAAEIQQTEAVGPILAAEANALQASYRADRT